MFCKWCGKTIQTTDVKCPSCGRQTPAMSDCGGFYNLKHSGNVPPASAPGPVMSTASPTAEKTESKYAGDQKATRSHHGASIIWFSAVMLAIILLGTGIWGIRSKLEEIEEIILVGSDETTPYHFQLDVTIESDEKTKVGVSYDFEDYAQAVVIQTGVEESEERSTADVCLSLKQDGSSTRLAVEKRVDDGGNTELSVHCSTDLVLFEGQEFEYSWQYTTATDDWVDVNEEMLSQAQDGELILRCQEDWLKTVVLRCNISIQNKTEDTMTITLNGIALSLDGTLESGG